MSFGRARLKSAAPGAVAATGSDAASADCSRSQPGMPNPSSESGRENEPRKLLLNPSATKAVAEGMFDRETRPVVPTMGRMLATGERPRAGLPQPVPKGVAVPGVLGTTPFHSHVSPSTT